MARLFYADKGTHTWTDTTSLTVLNLLTSNMTYPRNLRDLYIRIPHIAAGFGMFHAAIFKTLAEANSADFTGGDNDDPGDKLTDQTWLDANKVIAYITGVAWPSTSQSITVTNNANVAPNLAGLVLQVTGDGSAPITDHDGVWGLTATPEVLTKQKLDWAFQQYMSTGQALEDFTAARIEFKPSGVEIQSRAPHIIGIVTEAEDTPAAAGEFGILVRFVIGVGVIRKADEDCHDDALSYAGNIRSILQTERTLDGTCLEVVVTGIDGPEAGDGAGKEKYTLCRVNGFARFPRLTV